ncbi:MAG: tetratricopeptide repeat protein [Chitinophagaceae bacterium]
MSTTTSKHPAGTNDSSLESLNNFWTKYSKVITLVAGIIIVAIAGWYSYQEFYQAPREKKAVEAMFRAEDYYRQDSVALALNGDGQNLGFLTIINRYGGTKAANLANFYAGSCYLKLNENAKAIDYLKKFSTDSKLLQARAYKLLGDAYGDSGKNAEALSYYKKAGNHFEKDEVNSPEYLFMAAYFAEQVMKDSKQAIEIYEEIRTKFPRSQQSYDAEKYLARLGVYSSKN